MTPAFPSRPVILLSAAIALLVLLIAGQGTYLYRLEREEAQVRLQMERTQALYESARELLELEFEIPPELVDWEMRQLNPRGVPGDLRSTYHSWNTARLAAVMKGQALIRRLKSKSNVNLNTNQELSGYENLLLDLEIRHLQRVRPDVRAVLEEGP